MIEVTQKNQHGEIVTRETYTEKEFGVAYRYHNGWNGRPNLVDMFGTEHTMLGSHMEYISNDSVLMKRVTDFNFVAYNEKGKILHPSYLVGLVRKYQYKWKNTYRPGYRSSWGNVKVHERWKLIHTTPERRATYACKDQEEFAPTIRGSRNIGNLPHSWNWYDEQHRDYRNRNWKKFRKHQWKD